MLLPVVFAACTGPAPDARLASTGIDVELRHGWRDAAGRPADSVLLADGTLQVHHALELPERWRGLPLHLRVEGAGWEVRASLDGTEVAHGEGGQAPVSLDLGTDVGVGAHTLTLDLAHADPGNVPGTPISSWTFEVPVDTRVLWSGQATLHVGPASTPAAPPRIVTASTSGGFLQDGHPVYLAGRRLQTMEPGDRRASVFRQARELARSGGNAFLWHGDSVDGELLDAIDELGIPVVAIPRCAGRRQRAGRPTPDAPRDRFLDAQDAGIAALFGQHPSLAGWAIEFEHPGVTPSFAAMRTQGVPVFDRSRARAVHASERTNLPPWIIEVIVDGADWPPGDKIAELVRIHAAGGGIGLELPPGEPAAGMYTVVPPALAGLGVEAWNPDRERPGRATVRARTRAGGVVIAEADGHPSVAAVADDEGVATLELPWSGRTSLHRPDGEPLVVDAVAGTWRSDGWHPGTVDHTLPEN